MKNIGWTKKQAEAIAKKYRETHLANDAYAQREENFGFDIKKHSCQYIVILQKLSRSPHEA